MGAIPRRERLIVALDVPTAAEARALVERIGGAASFYKIGLELFASGAFHGLAAWLKARGCRVFADLKLHDIPETVRRAVAGLRPSGIDFLTVHAERGVMGAAVSEKGEIGILAVTLLTSTGPAELAEMGYSGKLEDLVLARAGAANELGCDGVIASGLEVSRIKQRFAAKLLAVVPGIRPAGGEAADQKRVVDVAQAFRNGADYIVVGRPIRDAADPAAAAAQIQRAIESVFPA